MKEFKRHLVTAALPYANGPLHIGHIAGAFLPSDIYVRYLRETRKDVVFVCGSDEHGAAITLRAKKEGVAAQEIVDKYHEQIKTSFADFGICFDIYHRTSSALHHQIAGDFFKKLHDAGVFEQKKTQQFFDEEHQQFLADRYITGTCPNCDYTKAYGDQCENCGSTLSPAELIDPKSSLSGKPPILRETLHWYLPMQKHETWLRDWIENGLLEGQEHHRPEEWRNQVRGQCKSWIDSGLQSRAMTRDLDWGVKVPIAGAEGKVLYVWMDAPIGYISATKQWAEDVGTSWEKYWKDDQTKLVHFIGKDNIVFHCIIFPILLKEHGDFVLPNNIIANEFLNLEADKISTSRNWAVWLHEYLEDFPGKQDVLRYVLTSIAPESKDSEFTWRDFQSRNNNELVAIYGNFVNRVIVLANKYYDGVVPELGDHPPTSDEEELVKTLSDFPEKVAQLIENYKFREAQAEVMNLARLGNRYLADTEPWQLIKTDLERVKTVMHYALQVVAKLSILSRPFLPETAKKIEQMLNVTLPDWLESGQLELLKPGHQIAKAALLFEKIEDEQVDEQLQKLQQSKQLKETI